MQKTIKINANTNMTLDNNVGWALKYRNQFGHDIVPDLMPIMSAFFDIAGGMFQRMDGEPETIGDFLKNIDADELTDAFITLSGLEFTTFLNLTWSLAKQADETIPDVEKWAEQFPVFPMDIIAPEVAKLIVKGLVSSKNLKRLRDKLPKPQTK